MHAVLQPNIWQYTRSTSKPKGLAYDGLTMRVEIAVSDPKITSGERPREGHYEYRQEQAISRTDSSVHFKIQFFNSNHPFPHARSKKLPMTQCKTLRWIQPRRGNPGTVTSTHHRPQRWLRVRGIVDRGWELALPRDRGIRKSKVFQVFRRRCASGV